MTGTALLFLPILLNLVLAADHPSSSSSIITTVISYFAASQETSRQGFIWATPTSIAASVIGTSSDATTYEVKCLSNAPISECSIASPVTLVAGPTTVRFKQPLQVTGTYEDIRITEHGFQDIKCSFTHYSESAMCTNTLVLTAVASNKSVPTTTVLSGPIASDKVAYQALTVIGALKKLNASGGANGGSATSTSHSNPAERVVPTEMPMGAALVVAAAAALV
ncbi:Uncharacterized protein PECH_007442 [Penicillium ucsense]|uniref:GPI anchored cell wall protein n=1 Tax=Penicillium ucsense TaxID=2839758 RepID=A0A8J8W2M1_9EURO|nr:Uncharacterized protein PECM_007305 [Penicillium ucsense]KAF7734810.1 Uncharacterized protein PECH_007442 [Penicillium ucsense]